MKMLALTIILLTIPVLSQAKGYKHHNDDYHKNHYEYSFWDVVDRRMRKQHKRIDRGIENGQLTHREIKKLDRKHRHLAKKIRRLRNRHYVSDSRKSRIMDRLDRLSSKIYDFKHNRQYARHVKHYRDNGHYVNKRYYHNQKSRNNRYMSTRSHDYSGGVYFRF